MKNKNSSVTKKTLVLLDAHAILHRAYHALPDFTAPNGEPTGALYGVVSMLLRIVEDIKPDYIAACYDLPEPTYRHLAYKEYKAGRAETEDSLVTQIKRSRDIFEAFSIPIYEHSGFEADDMLGTIVEQVKDRKDLSVVIASGDMDTFQLIEKKKVQVYMQRRGSEVVLYDEKGIKEKFGFGPLLTIDYKGLRGDASDNIPGVPGVGETTALRLVGRYGSIDSIYTALDKKGVEEVAKEAGIQKRFADLVFSHKDEARFSKELATIRKDAPIEFLLPDSHWIERVDDEAILRVCSELGFRTLATRIRTLLNIEADTLDGGAGVDPHRLKEAQIMLWLIASERTNASYEDIMDYGRSFFQKESFDEIHEALLTQIKEDDLLDVYENIELPLIDVIEKMNAKGITIDTKFLKELSTKLHKELDTLEKNIHAHAGETFNINSPKQLGTVLFDSLALKPKNQKKTTTGQRSTRESELEKMIDEHEIIPEILRYRELQKLTSTYVDNLPKMVDTDGRLRTTFLQTGTTTGRFSSKDPNLQNIPIRTKEGKDVRAGFVASKGTELVSLDYSQIELRVAAILSGDKKMIDIFASNMDVHEGVASQVFSVAPEEVTKDMRRRAKVINFGILYGMGVNALRGNLGEDTTRGEAQEFLNAYFNTFTRLAEYLEETKEYARQHGYTVTMFGRKRHFPAIQSGAPFLRASAERMAINAPVQGTAADIMRLAILRVDELLSDASYKDKAAVLLQVHDELLLEVDGTILDKLVPQIKKEMESVLDKKRLGNVPLLVDVAVGGNWRDLEDYKIDINK